MTPEGSRHQRVVVNMILGDSSKVTPSCPNMTPESTN